jgi:hypothetical protein
LFSGYPSLIESLHAAIDEFAADYTHIEGSRVNALYVVMMRTSVMEMSNSSIAKIRRCQFGSANSE